MGCQDSDGAGGNQPQLSVDMHYPIVIHKENPGQSLFERYGDESGECGDGLMAVPDLPGRRMLVRPPHKGAWQPNASALDGTRVAMG